MSAIAHLTPAEQAEVDRLRQWVANGGAPPNVANRPYPHLRDLVFEVHTTGENSPKYTVVAQIKMSPRFDIPFLSTLFGNTVQGLCRDAMALMMEEYPKFENAFKYLDV